MSRSTPVEQRATFAFLQKKELQLPLSKTVILDVKEVVKPEVSRAIWR